MSSELKVGARIVLGDGRTGSVVEIAEHPRYCTVELDPAAAFSYRMYRIAFDGWRKKVQWLRGAYIEGVIQEQP